MIGQEKKVFKKKERFRLDVRGNFFGQRVVRCLKQTVPGRLWMPHSWIFLRPGGVGSWAT